MDLRGGNGSGTGGGGTVALISTQGVTQPGNAGFVVGGGSAASGGEHGVDGHVLIDGVLQ